MVSFESVLWFALVVVLAAVLVAFFWPGILYYLALALAILFFPIIIAMCSGFGIVPGDDSDVGSHP